MKQLLFVGVFLTFVVCVLAADEQLLHYVSDDVSAGSYKYYSLMYDGIIKISLNSQSGDADLYVSQTTTKPTYEPEHYCLQSTTCGEDNIVIPQSFKRPVSIGVYGHPAHETSHFHLLVYQVTLYDQEQIDEQNPIHIFNDNQESNKPAKKSVILTFFWNLFMEFFQALL